MKHTKPKITYVDNYDSYASLIKASFNNAGADVTIYKSDCDLDIIASSNPDILLLGPGPSSPEEAGNYLDVINEFKGKKPMIGICLGFQAMIVSEGGKINPMRKNKIMHGENEIMYHTGKPPFSILEKPIYMARYNSLGIHQNCLPNSFEMLARNEQCYVMAVQHKQYDIIGFQFHPESHLSSIDDVGKSLIQNVLKMYTT